MTIQQYVFSCVDECTNRYRPRGYFQALNPWNKGFKEFDYTASREGGLKMDIYTCWSSVPVNNFVLVKVLQSTKDLGCIKLHPVLGKPWNAHFIYMKFQISSIH